MPKTSHVGGHVTGQWEEAVVISTLSSKEVIEETGQPLAAVLDHATVTLASVRFYDARGGGVETSLGDYKQGLGLTKRSKKRFAAQQMVFCWARWRILWWCGRAAG